MKQEVSHTQKVLNIWAIVLILWSFYRIFFKTSLPPWFDEFIAKPLVFIGPVYYFIIHVEKKSFFPAVDLSKKNLANTLMIGCGFGALFLLLGSIAYWVKMHSFFPANQSAGLLLSILGISFATSISEEILSRGFVLKRLYADSHHFVSSVFLSSVLFFILHIPMIMTDPALQGIRLIQVMVSDFLLSLIVSTLYLKTKNLWTPIIVHTCYALALYLFI
ncbi:CPBP family intramembrane metalloprotease [Candidatus Roizmanbacteria bacterium]|nr:CPBP family intramembrane metalloprotease [Candidatus Roizmanbacteria bacterium]